MLWKISWMIRYELGRVLISKKSKRVGLISIQESLGQASSLCQSALEKCRLALGKCRSTLFMCQRMALLGVKPVFDFLGFFDQSLHLDAFSSSVYNFFIFIFLNNLGFFRNNYLIDKYPKISLDKVHIIHNFIVIQSSLLFLCMHPYFKHYYQPITKLFN